MQGTGEVNHPFTVGRIGVVAQPHSLLHDLDRLLCVAYKLQ